MKKLMAGLSILGLLALFGCTGTDEVVEETTDEEVVEEIEEAAEEAADGAAEEGDEVTEPSEEETVTE